MTAVLLDEVRWDAGRGSDRKWRCGPQRSRTRRSLRAVHPDVIGQQFELARTEFFSI
jgi:hypothetical protein